MPALLAALDRMGHSARALRTTRMHSGECFVPVFEFFSGGFSFLSWRLPLRRRLRIGSSRGGAVSVCGAWVSLVAASMLGSRSVCVGPLGRFSLTGARRDARWYEGEQCPTKLALPSSSSTGLAAPPPRVPLLPFRREARPARVVGPKGLVSLYPNRRHFSARQTLLADQPIALPIARWLAWKSSYAHASLSAVMRRSSPASIAALARLSTSASVVPNATRGGSCARVAL